MKFAFVTLFWFCVGGAYYFWQRQRSPVDPKNWTLLQWERAGWSVLTLAGLAAVAAAVIGSFAWCAQ